MVAPLDIGPTLVAARVASGVTQRELAARLGVAQPQVARWEATEYRSASLSRVDAAARALGVDASAPLMLAAEPITSYGTTAVAPSDTGARALARLGVRPEAIAAFCRLHAITEMSLFGSGVRKDFGPTSDVDVLVTWAEGEAPREVGTLLDTQEELGAIFRRKVDLVDRASVERSPNHVRRSHILNGAKSVYVAG